MSDRGEQNGTGAEHGAQGKGSGACGAVLALNDTCWKTAKADRLGILPEADAYFAAFREAVLGARRQVVVLGWDFNTRMELVRDGEGGAYPTKLGPFLEKVLTENEDLEIYLLIWDYSLMYAAEREWQFFSDTLGDPPSRLHFVRDKKHCVGVSHHQKIVLIDDKLAFCGGLDLSIWRWDTPEHDPDDERRVDPNGKPYEPYHDVQWVMSGREICEALREECNSRWRRATGSDLPAPERVDETGIWPSNVEIETSGGELGLARTYSAWNSHPDVWEIEALHLAVIRSAKYYLYFENQYFSSNRIAEALIERLREPDGPEVVIVLNNDTEGIIEESTMGLMRNRLFERMWEADKGRGRVRFVYPVVYRKKGDFVRVYVHAKVILADDCVLKIGSANLSNRSMRVDSEVDVIYAEASESDFVVAARNRLLSIHLGTTPEAVQAEFDTGAGICEVIDRLTGEEGCSFRPIEFGVKNDLARQLADSQLLDPDEPMDPRHWVERTVPEDERPSTRRRVLTWAGVIVAGAALAGVLKLGWGEVLDKEAATSFLERVNAVPWAPAVLFAIFVGAGFAGVPISLLQVAATVVFGPWVGFACGFGGSHVGALLGFGLGRAFGTPLVKKLPFKSVHRLDGQLEDMGILTVAFIRMLPIAPFAVVNIVAGASKLKFRVFNWGTALGMAPTMGGIVLVTYQLEQAVTDPNWLSISLFLVVLAAVGLGIWLIVRGLKRGSAPLPTD